MHNFTMKFYEYQIRSLNDQSQNSILAEWFLLEMRTQNTDQLSD